MARRTRRALLAACGLAVAVVAARAGDLPAELPPPPGPDFGFYEARIAPFVESSCASCHREGGGRLRLPAPGPDGAVDRARDFAALVPFIDARAPWRSPFLLKVLSPADGGDEHVGGSFLRADDDLHDLLLDFVSGATLDNLPPEAWLEEDTLRASPGDTVEVDGRDSFDRDCVDRSKLRFFWELVARPPDSRVSLADRRAGALSLVPDSPGTYVVRLRVGDEHVWGAPRDVTIEVLEGGGRQAGDPASASVLERLEPEMLVRVRRLYIDLLGRPPRPDEAWADGRRNTDALAADLLGRAEHGRCVVEDATVALGLVDDDRPTSAQARDLALRVPSEGLSPVDIERVLLLDPAARRVLADPAAGPDLLGAVLTSVASDGRLEPGDAGREVAAAFARVLAGEGPQDIPGLGRIDGVAGALDALLASEAFADVAVRRYLGRVVGEDMAARHLLEARLAIREGPAAWRQLVVRLVTERAREQGTTRRPKGRLRLLRSLFVDLLGRRPTDRELVALVRATDRLPGEMAPHTVLAKVLLDSGQVGLPLLVDIPDAPRWLTDRFLLHLGRRPAPDELEAYGRVLLDPDGGVELVVLALVTNAEYACR
ncbi:MAG: hypothetical protein AB7T63_06330 [Planctomycetota bacterium]